MLFHYWPSLLLKVYCLHLYWTSFQFMVYSLCLILIPSLKTPKKKWLSSCQSNTFQSYSSKHFQKKKRNSTKSASFQLGDNTHLRAYFLIFTLDGSWTNIGTFDLQPGMFRDSVFRLSAIWNNNLILRWSIQTLLCNLLCHRLLKAPFCHIFSNQFDSLPSLKWRLQIPDIHVLVIYLCNLRRGLAFDLLLLCTWDGSSKTWNASSQNFRQLFVVQLFLLPYSKGKPIF